MADSTPTIFLLAGEHSGDRIGADLMQRISARKAFVPIGVGGPLMETEGLRSIFPMSDLAVMGFSDVIRRLPLLLWRVRQTVRTIMRTRPDATVLIDAQVFSQLVASRLRRAGYRGAVLLYVAPSVWAWKPERAPKLRTLFDEVLAVLPMEPEVMDRLGGPKTSYVGHPALQAIPRPFDLPRNEGLLALLPGSRAGEIRRHMPMLKALAESLADHPRVRGFVMPTLPGLQASLAEQTSAWHARVEVVSDKAARNAALAQCLGAVVTAGTITLELALMGIPMVGTYIPDKRLMHHYEKAGRPMIALPNIILQRRVVPEVVPDESMLDVLTVETRRMLDSAEWRSAQFTAFAELRALMEKGAPGAPLQNPADRVLSHLPVA